MLRVKRLGFRLMDRLATCLCPHPKIPLVHCYSTANDGSGCGIECLVGWNRFNWEISV